MVLGAERAHAHEHEAVSEGVLESALAASGLEHVAEADRAEVSPRAWPQQGHATICGERLPDQGLRSLGGRDPGQLQRERGESVAPPSAEVGVPADRAVEVDGDHQRGLCPSGDAEPCEAAAPARAERGFAQGRGGHVEGGQAGAVVGAQGVAGHAQAGVAHNHIAQGCQRARQLAVSVVADGHPVQSFGEAAAGGVLVQPAVFDLVYQVSGQLHLGAGCWALEPGVEAHSLGGTFADHPQETSPGQP